MKKLEKIKLNRELFSKHGDKSILSTYAESLRIRSAKAEVKWMTEGKSSTEWQTKRGETRTISLREIKIVSEEYYAKPQWQISFLTALGLFYLVGQVLSYF